MGTSLKITAIASAILLSVSVCSAEDWTTTDGKSYKGVTVIKHDAATVTIIYSDGGAEVPLANLPSDLQKRFDYDSAKAATALAQKLAAVKAENQANADAVKNASANRQEEAKYEALFQFPPNGHVGNLGETMRITATFLAQLNPDVATVTFMSHVVQSTTETPESLYSGGDIMSDPIAIYGLPSSFAAGDTWKGIVYPAGTMIFGVDKYHVYATTKEQAITLLKQQGQTERDRP